MGLNDFKLKRGFRELLGTTVYGSVRRVRMEKARELVEAGAVSVTQAVHSVGFSSLGHFAEAFKRSFGALPKHYRRARKFVG